MALATVSLDDKYTKGEGRAYMTGTQALVRLLLDQAERDRRAGLDTAGFVSGYRGSPLGALDQALWAAQPHLDTHRIRFVPGVNEELAATAVWGAQQANLFPEAKHDGVFALWYGKAPGVERTGDVFRHGNSAGTARHGGVLVLAGDDHACESSTLASHSEYAFVHAMIPVLNPAGVQELLDFGLYGLALSRYSGCWVAMKVIAETVESSAAVDLDPGRIAIRVPEGAVTPPEGFNLRWPDNPLAQEKRLHEQRLDAVLAFARANSLDRIVLDSPTPRFGILATGKSYLDVRQALHNLGIDTEEAAAIGLRLYKVGLTWPLEPQGARAFAEGLEEILVVEEKRGLVESQLKERLFERNRGTPPRIVGKFDEEERWLLPSAGELTPARIARVIAARLARFHTSPAIHQRLAFLDAKEKELAAPRPGIERRPYFCSGCPHNTSTRVPEGSRAIAGIGCHYMAVWMNRSTVTATQMGGEGANWIGQAPFTNEHHVFVNLGDGTYVHSGLLAIRAAIAAGVNATYKILYNDAVAMTGGQPVEGHPSVARITRQIRDEGVGRIVVVTDEPEKYPKDTDFAPGVTVAPRQRLEAIQKELRQIPGITALVYDQTCAAEKRRRRRRGLLEDPPLRTFIHETVCEGCGDCMRASNCLSVVPTETALGRKMRIDQHACNKDFSCLTGFCPSFVTVHGSQLRKPPAAPPPNDELPQPPLPDLDSPYGILIAGTGGTGVVTIAALLGMAAHLEGKAITVLDMAGVAQKGGAVYSHVRITNRRDHLHAARIATGEADTLLGCDLVAAAAFDSLAKVDAGRTRAVINAHETPTGDFTLNPDLPFPGMELRQAIEAATGEAATEFVEATRLAVALTGEAIASNILLLGHAWQKGLIPLSADAIERAIAINGVAVEANRGAFRWGRLTAHAPQATETAAKKATGEESPEETQSALPVTLEERVDRHTRFLADYQSRRLAGRYANLVSRARSVEQERVKGSETLAGAVAGAYFRLLAVKDEYEVARLFTETPFLETLRQRFEDKIRFEFHLAPPVFFRRDPDTGLPLKGRFGEWVIPVFRGLAKLRFLRGTPLDPFRHLAERKRERLLVAEYERRIDELLDGLTPENHRIAVEIAELPLGIRGYGHVKAAAIDTANECEESLLAAFRAPPGEGIGGQ